MFRMIVTPTSHANEVGFLNSNPTGNNAKNCSVGDLIFAVRTQSANPHTVDANVAVSLNTNTVTVALFDQDTGSVKQTATFPPLTTAPTLFTNVAEGDRFQTS